MREIRTAEALRDRTFPFVFFFVVFNIFLVFVSVRLTSGSSRLRMTLDMDEHREPRFEVRYKLQPEVVARDVTQDSNDEQFIANTHHIATVFERHRVVFVGGGCSVFPFVV